MPSTSFTHSHPYVRLRKYIRHKKDIRNTLYKRFTLSNRGNTPLSFKTKYLNFTFTETKSLKFFRSVYSRRLGRIYHINGKDWRFDFSSCMAPKEIIDLSKSLDPSDVCAVYTTEPVSGSYVYHYVYPFRKTEGVGYITEKSSLFYPGLYYSRGEWMWTDKLSNSLFGLKGRQISSFSYTTDYTSGEIEDIDNDLVGSESVYFIYIPFSSIKTPSVQAYLPLSMDPIYLKQFEVGDTTEIRSMVTNTIFWMGRPLQLFGWHEPFKRGKIFMNRSIQPHGITPAYDSIKENLIATIYHNTIPIDANFHHLYRVNLW